MSREWQVEELLAEVRRRGYSLTRRTFLYYVQLGLLPKGVRRGQPSGGVKFFYPPETLPRLLKILELKKAGLKLKEIRDRLGPFSEEEAFLSEKAPVSEEVFSREKLRNCSLCGLCGGICPVYEEMEVPAWRALQAYLEREPGLWELNTPWICVGCYLCQEACPEGIPLTTFLEALRREARRKGTLKISMAGQWHHLFWTLLQERGRSFDFGATHAYRVQVLREGERLELILKLPSGSGVRQIKPPPSLKNPELFREMLAEVEGS
ncbi:MerR family transcriptional regulator [Thermosulfurimonas marina]|uniref:MerR family transcriptional regulator n=1 Tax=Thermosulfurimonas marina TaxID=2047767 RepID=A0A6H1WSL5_9BACT|nr:4Fe-4S dicluster domain-containing protein [Thermosulfurimonas marina]QJA06161.1 MerR family transcriptional regulator [Thermosulfurimonas marina]